MVKKKDLQRLQVAGSERVSRGKRRRKRVEKSSGKGECNAQAHRRFVCTRARGESSEEALRLVGGWSVERSRRRPNREEERFPKKRTEKTGNRGQTKSRFSYSASKGVETSQRNRGARSSLLFQARSILFSKKEKKDSQTLPHFRSKTIVRFKDRWIENGENL